MAEVKKSNLLGADKEDLNKKLEAEAAAKKKALAELETRLTEKTAELANANATLDGLRKENRGLTEDVAVLQQNLKDKTTEVNTLRGQIRTVQAESDANAKLVVEKTEKNNQLAGDLGRLKERNAQLAEQQAKSGLLLAKVDMTSETPLDLQPPKVDGMVLATSGTQNDLLEISLGSDDGLRVGHTVDVYREGKYLARAEIKKIDPNRAVAQVDPKIHLGPIQKGDRVTTRIKT